MHVVCCSAGVGFRHEAEIPRRPFLSAFGVKRTLATTASGADDPKRTLVPTAAQIACLRNPKGASADTQTRDVEAAARTIGQQIFLVDVRIDRELDSAFTTIVQQRAGALLVMGDPLFTNLRDQLVALAAKHAVPAMYPFREFISAGGLINYGPSIEISASRYLHRKNPQG